MSPRPFFLRLLVPFVLAAVIMAVVTGGIIFWLGRGTVHWEQVRTLDLVTRTVSRFASTLMRTHDQQSGPKRTASNFNGLRRPHHHHRRRMGVVIFETHASASTMDNHNDRPEVL